MAKGKMNPLLGVAIGVGAVLLSSKENRDKAMDMMEKVKDKAMNMWGGTTGQNNQMDVVEKAGHPDPHDLEDNKMVAEGSQYGVNYYNKEEQQE